MIPQYDSKRRCYICYVNKANKDNRIVKKGESYIWVKNSPRSLKELFKDEFELNKKYPKHYDLTSRDLITLLNNFKIQINENKKLSPTQYLKELNFD